VSADNLETAQRAFTSFNEHGFGSEETLSFFDDSVVFEEPPEQPAPRVARGRDEAAQMFTEFDEAWETHISESQDFIALDDGRVLVLTIEHFRGRDGIEITQPSGVVLTFRDGKIVRMEAFWEQSTAREAAGLGK
jgi:ketosteroid isomerase-like protein